MKIKKQDRKRKLRICARCCYVFWYLPVCPKCGFAHYDAVWVYDGWLKAIRRWITQWEYKQKIGENYE